MDAGQAADLPEGVAGKRLPPWILPKVDNETRRKLRPDILIIEGLDSNTVPQENTNKYAKFINNLKLRLNYGITGNQPGESYLSLLRLSSLSPQWYSWYDGNFYPEYSVVNNANPDLKWEKKGEFDAGFDFSIFKTSCQVHLIFTPRKQRICCNNILFQSRQIFIIWSG